VQEDNRNSIILIALSFKEKAAVEGTPPSAVSGLAAFSNDGLNFFFFQNTSSVIFLFLFVFCTLFFHSVQFYFKDLKKKLPFQRLKSLCYELEGIPLDFFPIRTADSEIYMGTTAI